MTAEDLDIRSLDGLTLEAALETPPHPKATLVLCHPHPKMGGTMNAPLLLALQDELAARRWAVLRFNFRGIGASRGEPSTGEPEVADALGAASLARERFTNLAVAIAGWSFGAAVAVRAAARDDALAACVAIAPPAVPKPGITAGLPEPSTIELNAPLLVIWGSNDDQVGPENCRAWAERVPGAVAIELPAANHFFWGKYDQLSTRVADFLDEHVAAPSTS